MVFKHSYAVITTNFDLEPVLERYFKTYPNGEFESYEIVFKTENEHREGDISYIIVFNLNKPEKDHIRFSEFLDAYCKLENRTAVASVMNHILPKLSGTRIQGHVFGKLMADA